MNFRACIALEAGESLLCSTRLAWHQVYSRGYGFDFADYVLNCSGKLGCPPLDSAAHSAPAKITIKNAWRFIAQTI